MKIKLRAKTSPNLLWRHNCDVIWIIFERAEVIQAARALCKQHSFPLNQLILTDPTFRIQQKVKGVYFCLCFQLN